MLDAADAQASTRCSSRGTTWPLSHALRAARVRRARRRLPAEAVQRRAARRGAGESAGTTRPRGARAFDGRGRRGAAGSGLRDTDPRSRWTARARDSARKNRLRAGAGRLRVLLERGKRVFEGADARGSEASLNPARFVRIHRSYLISLDRLVRVELDERENRVAVLTTGQRLPVSRAGYQRLNRVIE